MAKSEPMGNESQSRPTILVRLAANVETDIARLEERLKLTLPNAYRHFLLDYPSVLFETKTDLRWCHESLADRQLLFNIDELIYHNEDVRAPGTPWTYDDGPWPDQYFVIGDDRCGNFWVIDVSSDDQAVLFYDHDIGKFVVEHKTIQAFADDLVRSTIEWNEEQYSRRDGCES